MHRIDSEFMRNQHRQVSGDNEEYRSKALQSDADALQMSFLLLLHKVFGRHPAVKLFAQKTVETTGSRHDPDRLGAGGRHHLSTDTGHVRQHCTISG